MADPGTSRWAWAEWGGQASGVVEALGPVGSGVGVEPAARVDAAVRQEDLLGANPDAVIGVDRSGVIRLANGVAAELFDYSLNVLVGSSIERLVPEGARARHGPLVEMFFDRPDARRMGAGLPLAARRRDGTVFLADISLAVVESASHGPLTMIVVVDVTEHRRERMVAAQYLVTQALAESDTLESAAARILESVGPASGASVAVLWHVDGSGAIGYVDSWCATERLREFHEESVGFVFPQGLGIPSVVVADPHVHWSNDVLADPLFLRQDLARRLDLHAGVWVPFADDRKRVVGVLELLFGFVRDADPGMLRILEGFATQLAQYVALRQSEADRQRVLGQIVRSVEDERRRIASDLHDDTVQVLVASLISIDRLAKAVDPTNAPAHEQLKKVRETLEAATERTRHLIFDLRPQLLEAEGLIPAITEIANVAGVAAGFDVHVELATPRYDPAVEALLYRVMQEAIMNARKHSRATRLDCSVRPEADSIVGRVADNGVGFRVDDEMSRARQRMSFGLATIIELIRLARGRVDIQSTPGNGTIVTITLPEHLTTHGYE